MTGPEEEFEQLITRAREHLASGELALAQGEARVAVGLLLQATGGERKYKKKINKGRKLLQKIKKKIERSRPATGNHLNLLRKKAGGMDTGETKDEVHRVSIFLFGLDRAGKTTLVEYLKQGKYQDHAPTLGINVTHVVLGNVKIEFNDLGGQAAFRKSWLDYWAGQDLIIFMIDSSDRARFGEAKDAFWSVVADDRTAGKPLLVLANKIDLQDAAGEHEIAGILELNTIKDRVFSLKAVSIKENIGLEAPLNFIASIILGEDEMREFVSEKVREYIARLQEEYSRVTAQARKLEKDGDLEAALVKVFQAKVIQDELFEEGFSQARGKALKCIEWMTRLEKEMNARGIHPAERWWEKATVVPRSG